MVERLKAPPLPDVPPALGQSIDRAKTRTLSRRHGPVMGMVQGDDGEFEWDWPFRDDGDNDWKWLMLDAFGTRYAKVAACFVNHLIDLCSQKFDDKHDVWVPEPAELTMMLHIISAHQPKNEAQAALAAQIAATHLLTMRVAKRVADYTYDTRMISAFAKLVRASAAQIETMATLKGKRRTARQQISVSHEKHIHHHQHVHMAGGVDHASSQPDGPKDETGDENFERARLIEGGAIVPGAAKARSRPVRCQGHAR